MIFTPLFDNCPLFCLLVKKIHTKASQKDKKWSAIIKKRECEKHLFYFVGKVNKLVDGI